jgi:hypothetical protein
MDLIDLKTSLEHGDTPEKVAEFLCRAQEEARTKMAELGLGGGSARAVPS